jgi:intein-encoded DNA endonuclease-like protein
LDYDLIISTYKKTQNIAETARILKYSRDSIKNILENNNIKIKPNQEIAKEK